ncbi:uracil-DNA glycosylase family protein [Polaromonas hydrogenivorans]|uniref:Uracil-DNA glycosylase family protein n=1 Tax=Polaromonas hydrogenivorans TaxID=335476 RepID=A0AAU7LQW9_9BURK
MSMNLDPRQRAMLREMGVRVWQPLAPVAEIQVATEVIAAHAGAASANDQFDQHFEEKKAVAAPAAPAVRRDAAPARPASPPPLAPNPAAPSEAAPAAGAQPCWRVGQAQLLYAETAKAGGARWLVLAQTPSAALQAPVFDGDAGRLLDNMLRAARLNRDAGAVLFAPLVRQAVSGAMDELPAALLALVEQARPDVVLVMGRLAAQALLQSGEPFGKLRGRPHALHGRQTVVTHDAPYLLRCPQDKAKAWDDLCLAMRLAARGA